MATTVLYRFEVGGEKKIGRKAMGLQFEHEHEGKNNSIIWWRARIIFGTISVCQYLVSRSLFWFQYNHYFLDRSLTLYGFVFSHVCQSRCGEEQNWRSRCGDRMDYITGY